MDSRVLFEQGDITQIAVDAIVNAANYHPPRRRRRRRRHPPRRRPRPPRRMPHPRRLPHRPGRPHPRLPPPRRATSSTPSAPSGQAGPKASPSCWPLAIATASAWPTPRDARTIAFPAISCGVYGYPIPQAADIALRTLAAEVGGTGIQAIQMVLFSEDTLQAFQEAWERVRADLGEEAK